MIERVILDTNVISAAIRGDWPLVTQEWFAATRERHTLTVITVMELVHGVQRMPAGRRRSETAAAIDALVSVAQVVDFTSAAAIAAGTFRADRAAIGRPLDLADAQIAGICAVSGASLATRNTRDFEGLGLSVVDPWQM